MSHTRFPILEACPLCGVSNDLMTSHLLPDFLFKRLRAPTGAFYAASRPSRAIQAGATARMLCLKCEQSISRWEGRVQKVLFPHGTRAKLPLQYGPWLQLFAVSVSWRTLAFLKYATKNPFTELPSAAAKLLPTLAERHHERAEEALARWGSVLREEGTDIGEFQQHLIFLNGNNVPHEYSQVVGFTVYETNDTSAVFSQLGSLCILGIISEKDPHSWEGTQLQPEGGTFPIGTQVVPASFGAWLTDYFKHISETDS